MDAKIDFEESSNCWRQNKKYKGKGYFVYTCNYIHSNCKKCSLTVHSMKSKCYNVNFAGIDDKYKNHPNRDIYCKKHINKLRNI